MSNPTIYLDPKWNRWMADTKDSRLILGYESEIDKEVAETVLLDASADSVRKVLAGDALPFCLMRLGFDPDTVCEKGEVEDDIRFADIWRDPLARCLWCIGKRGYLTNQHYRGNVVNSSLALREDPSYHWWAALFADSWNVPDLSTYQEHVNSALRLALHPGQPSFPGLTNGRFFAYRLDLHEEAV
jgi:hypothetical protein